MVNTLATSMACGAAKFTKVAPFSAAFDAALIAGPASSLITSQLGAVDTPGFTGADVAALQQLAPGAVWATRLVPARSLEEAIAAQAALLVELGSAVNVEVVEYAMHTVESIAARGASELARREAAAAGKPLPKSAQLVLTAAHRDSNKDLYK